MLFHTFNLIVSVPHQGPTTPEAKPPVWALPLSLATTYGIDSLSFPPVTEMFHFTGCREPAPMYSERDDTVLTVSGYPIRKSPGQSVFAAIRGLSQLITSFIACWHQGIHHALLTACFSLFKTRISQIFAVKQITKSATRGPLARESLGNCIFFYPVCSCQRTDPGKTPPDTGERWWV